MSSLRPVIEGERIDQVPTLAGYLVVAVLSGHVSTNYRLPLSHISTFTLHFSSLLACSLPSLHMSYRGIER